MAKKHFFQPLLPGFYSHLTIPVAFFSKHMQGRNDQKTTAKLRSDASDKTWEVKKTEDDGRRLTDGWKEFALAHDLRVGDVLIFRQEKDMTFHVTLFGPSCCEIQYESSCLDDKNNIQGKINSKKKNPKREAECSSSDPSCFLASVMPSTLRYDLLNLPMSFVRANGLETRRGEDIVLMNDKGRSWTLSLKQRQCGKRSYITRGWRSFCSANGLKAGDFFSFKLIKRGGTLVLLLRKSPSHRESKEEGEGLEADDEIESLSTESDSDEESNQGEKRRISIWKASSSPSLNRFVTLTLKPYNVTKCVLFLPKPFTDLHGITVGTKMSLVDKQGVKWSTKLRSEGKDRIRMAGGWKDFFKANCVKTGESIKLKLIWEDDTSCVLKFCSKVKP